MPPRFLPLVFALALLPCLPVDAATITGLSVTNSSTNVFVNSGANREVAQSATSVLSSAVNGFNARYAAVAGADVSGPGGVSFTQSLSGSFTVSFQVTENPGWNWWITIDVTRAGALTVVNDGNGSASVTLGALTVTKTGAGSLSGGLGLAAVGTIDNASAQATSLNSPFSQSSTATLSGFGTGAPQLVTLTLSFSASARTVDTPGGAVKGDEAALRMGLDSALGGNGAMAYTADNYPGAGGRTLAADGILVTATALGEPSAAALLTLGMLGLVGFDRVQRRRS